MIKNLEKLLQFLPLGYLYLIILGILKQSLLYNQLGVNILNYSSVMDILLGPIADLTANISLIIAVIMIVTLTLALSFYVIKNTDKRITQKLVGLKTDDISTAKENQNKIKNRFLLAMAVFLLSFFLGFGWGSGAKIAKKIKSNQLEFLSILKFNTGEKQQIYLIGSNSLYYFYVTKENKNVKIAPITAIKEIELQPKL